MVRIRMTPSTQMIGMIGLAPANDRLPGALNEAGWSYVSVCIISHRGNIIRYCRAGAEMVRTFTTEDRDMVRSGLPRSPCRQLLWSELT